jgi:uncharacterized protein YkwD
LVFRSRINSMKKLVWLGLVLSSLLMACPSFKLHEATLSNDFTGATGDTLIQKLNEIRASLTITPISCVGTPAPYSTARAALVRDSQLDKGALSHADYLTKNHAAGTIMNGGDPHNAAGDGTAQVRLNTLGFSTGGEILARGFFSNQDVLYGTNGGVGWMTSARGHCQAILDSDYNRVGVARVSYTFNAEDQNYWVVMFGKK